MHEIGHIYLKHLLDFEATQIYRGSLTSAENKVLEIEANVFARNVLAPVSMLLTLKDKSVSNVAHTFGITQTAAETRIDFFNRDVELIKHLNLSQKIMLVYHRFMNKQKCTTCGAQFFNKYLYCPICGQKTLQWGDGKMYYPKFDSYDNGKIKICPVCNNEETLVEGGYCQICGNSLINHCVNEECSPNTPLPSNARYCPLCGGPTTFLRNRFLDEWDHIEDFMHIPDGDYNSAPILVEELPFD